MSTRIYPFPTPIPTFLRKYTPPQGDRFVRVFLGGAVAGALIVGLAWWAASAGSAPATPTVTFRGFDTQDFDECVDRVVDAAATQARE